MNVSFTPEQPRHVLYGFSKMEVGEQTIITPAHKDNIAKVRGHLTSYAVYYDRKFKTKIVGEKLAILRVK